MKAALLYALLPAAIAAASPAQAALKLCNRTSYVLYAATASVKTPGSETRGWTRIAPGDCQTARSEDLTGQNYLAYARSSLAYSGPSHAWGGNFPLCVRDTNFDIRQAVTQPYCTDADTFALPFAPLDTQGHVNWTMTFDEKPAYPSLTAAQLAGVKRLLNDTGYKVGPADAKPNRQTGSALDAFRTRMRFATTAGNTELFEALETEALKKNAPTGYTVCNDTSSGFMAALAGIENGKPVSRGWWTVTSGACARVLTAALNADTVYLSVQGKNGAALVAGPEKFCVTAAAFEIQGRGGCSGRGFQELGFAPTVTRGRAGYIVHVGGNGMLAPLPVQAGTLK